ncbi:MAG: helix-turn-helix domain-containing protein [Oscillospiraceae bacterium]|nr:helix-turn-helix domain-containing protein [Oscillospiraceae bacterium]
MAEMDINCRALANYLGKSSGYISAHFNNKYSWEIDVAYKILDFLQVPKEQIVEYFPPNGGLPQKTAKRKGKQI